MQTRKRFSVTGCLKITAIAGALAAMALPVQAEQWRGWNIHPPGYPNSVALQSFAKEVAKTTDGRVEPKVYDNAVLGDQPDAIEQTRSGALDFANFNMGPMGPIVPATNVLSLPFIFKSVDDMYRIMNGEIGQRLADALAEKNLIALSWFGSGARSLYNTEHPIRTPADVKGIKARVMNNDLYVEMIDNLGGNATPMAYGEVYQALKTGVIDGAENNYPSYESSGHYEVAKYYSLTQHLILPECLCVAKSSWDALSEQDQKAVRAAAEHAATEQRKLWQERVEKSKEKVLASGVKINEVDDKAAFQAKMQPIYDEFIKQNPQLESLVKDIQAAQ
ncbi:TRAP transporter substrate-binding protein [Marinobacter halodurans]|uniref:TRAP transporter substrate-binding protein n=1 Tax=Marinobacter halodurans TaxID=2528979 RepID=A0ABY1ZHC1_9GAMM|nr:TRAP transporter substrate-binding protein [Marinobacter halodurans]TBW52547.1 TRAP transporter substrate-binding protein [Marinobacter halodurans]